PVASLARRAVYGAMAAAGGDPDGSGGVRRAPRRLVRDRGGAPALYGLWAVAHRGFGFAARGAGGCRLGYGLRHRVSRGVRRRHFLFSALDGVAAAHARNGTPNRRPYAERPHHAPAGGPAAIGHNPRHTTPVR